MTIFGVDLSSYQAGTPLAGVRSEGFDFAFCKVSQGVGYRSPDWPRQRDEARAAGLILAGYHYIDTTAPDAQAANCAGWLGDPSIPLALDFEAGSGDVAHYRAVLAAFGAHGLRVALSYIPRWYWQRVGSPSLAGLPPLWSSRYPSTAVGYASNLYAAVTAGHWAGYGGLEVAVLQFASTALVQGRQVDANAFLGTRNDLINLLGAGAPGPAPTPGGPVATDSDRIRETWHQVAGTIDTPAGPLPGWPSWPGGTDESLTLVDYARRNNVEVRQLHVNLNAGVHPKLDALTQKVDALAAAVAGLHDLLTGGMPGTDGPRAVSPADVAAIAKAVNDDAARRLDA